MTLNEISLYKDKILSGIFQSEEIAGYLLGDSYHAETAKEDLNYIHVFPYLHIPDPAAEAKPYLCVEVDIPRTLNLVYKDMKVMVWAYCPQNIMDRAGKDRAATLPDLIADAADTLLNGSGEFRIGKLKLESVSYFTPSEGFYGKQLIYKCLEFDTWKTDQAVIA